MSNQSVIRIPPNYYIHVLDNNTNVTTVVEGPLTYTRQDHVRVVFGPERKITVPPRHYCIVEDPAERDEDSNVVKDQYAQVKLRFGDREVRLTGDPFCLYPGEKLVGSVQPLRVVLPNQALRLRATRDVDVLVGDARVSKVAGDEWVFVGPGTYIPQVAVEIAETISATVIKPNQALKLHARRATTDAQGKARKAGEEWLVRTEGAYLPGVDEIVVGTINAHVLTEQKALHLRAKKSYTDVLGVERKAGQEWLISLAQKETYIPDVYEEVVDSVFLTTLSNRQYCVIEDPIVNGQQQFGRKVVRKGECSFFLQPGERMESGIQNVYVLGEEEALLLKATQPFTDEVVGEDGKVKREKRAPGEVWMVSGPSDYIPPVEVEVLDTRRIIPLDETDGVYVRNIKTGQVRAVTGQSYMLTEDEELWEKPLPKAVEELLAGDSSTPRDRTRVVTYRVPHNSAVQVYDYRSKVARVVFGPDLVLLAPDEQFTQLRLSGDTPKRPNVVRCLELRLGPSFMSDVVTVETSDHARLSLQLSYNWRFEVDRADPAAATRLFNVPDFVGSACKAVASRVRGAVAAVPFDKFHRSSAKLIRAALFGIDDDGKVREEYLFKTNGLVISSIDVQSVEPVDQRTRDALQKSVQLAIEITTKSQEATAKHEAARTEQEARGRLERQKIEDEAAAETSRRSLLELQAQSAAVESTGQATAEATARAEAAAIEGAAAVQQAQLKAEAEKIASEAELQRLQGHRAAELEHQRQLLELEVKREEELASVESEKFAHIVAAIGPDTIASIARAGPEMQAKLLSGLNLSSVLLTDGSSPVNLFNTAQGLVGGINPGAGAAGSEASFQ